MDNGKRHRGSSPRGEFEQSKAVATAMIEDQRAADRLKTESLRAARLRLKASQSGPIPVKR